VALQAVAVRSRGGPLQAGDSRGVSVMPDATLITHVSLSPRRNSYGEFVCRAYGADGKRAPDCDYHTDDWADAVQTRQAMLAPFLAQSEFVA
jgi:hypothetical protein